MTTQGKTPEALSRPPSAGVPRPNIPIHITEWALVISKVLHEKHMYPQAGLRVKGLVTGTLDGEARTIITSPVRKRYGDVVISTSGHYYSLGKPSKAYAKDFPFARDIFLSGLKDASQEPGTMPPMKILPHEPSHFVANSLADLPDSFDDFPEANLI